MFQTSFYANASEVDAKSLVAAVEQSFLVGASTRVGAAMRDEYLNTFEALSPHSVELKTV